MTPINEVKFIVDQNVGKLARWLRIMGYDTSFFDGGDDSYLIRQALHEDRIILTRDSGIVKRRVVTIGKIRAILIASSNPEQQMLQVMRTLNLDCCFKPFSLCLECNQPLVGRTKQEVKDHVPPYVLKTQEQYMECPSCHRIYWRGTHWVAMMRRMKRFAGDINHNKN